MAKNQNPRSSSTSKSWSARFQKRSEGLALHALSGAVPRRGAPGDPREDGDAGMDLVRNRRIASEAMVVFLFFCEPKKLHAWLGGWRKCFFGSTYPSDRWKCL